MTQSILEQFSQALRRMRQPALFKLVAPGAHKFLMRRWARARKGGMARKTRLFFGEEMEVVLMETGSSSSLQAGRILARLGYRPHVADSAGNLGPWPGSLEQANETYKDLLFLP
ncbi:MAG: hypothetical protein HYU77_03925 [Betaproteobacteria bacterium]|nr:hypothetical protein [Betaproteobacteria bacterium]